MIVLDHVHLIVDIIIVIIEMIVLIVINPINIIIDVVHHVKIDNDIIIDPDHVHDQRMIVIEIIDVIVTKLTLTLNKL